MIIQKVAPSQEDINKILSLDEAKSFMRIVSTDEDEDIQSYIKAAIADAEGITNRQFAKATYELYLSIFPWENFKLPKNPINKIVSIEYMDLEGNYQTIDQSTYYLFSRYEVGHIAFNVFPNFKIKNHKKAVRITFTSGYLEDFPMDLKQWLKVRVSTLNENREEITLGVSVSKNNHVDSILKRYRIRS